ncbi:phosphatidylinositol 4,5-bisphosphate 5-phosphatase A-like isoform X1 [Anguilla rostrata]|uniref:phosphatidylinositol 4,5-bisphosphate 5-phosphatase A-like isoform X1 n=2 Tax=Anguilla rostrata TaxID=7938 RepID=UPI0030D4206F
MHCIFRSCTDLRLAIPPPFPPAPLPLTCSCRVSLPHAGIQTPLPSDPVGLSASLTQPGEPGVLVRSAGGMDPALQTRREPARASGPVPVLVPMPVPVPVPTSHNPAPPKLAAPSRNYAPVTVPIYSSAPHPLPPKTSPVAPKTTPALTLSPSPIGNSAPKTTPVLPLPPAPTRHSAPVTAPASTHVLPLLPGPVSCTASITAPVTTAASGARSPRGLLATPIATPAAPPKAPPTARPRPTGLGVPPTAMPPWPSESVSSSATPHAGRGSGAGLSPTGPAHLLPAPPPPKASPSGGSAHTPPQKDKTSSELEEFRVHIVTWNVGSAAPPDDIASLFGPDVADGNTDMYVVGLQEVNSMINMRLKDVLFTDQWTELCMDSLSRFGYVLVTSHRMQGVQLLVFCRYPHLPFLRGVQTQSTRTGLGGYWGNKGGVSARMTVFGHPICFLNCHLPAHMQNAEQRMEDFETILHQQQFEGGVTMGVLDHNVVFWFGDLNFRIEGYDTHVVKSAIDNNTLSLLWERDQLNMVKQSARILEGFMEGPLQFPPTYKFDVGTHTYDTSAKKRKPAWTDRILWRLRASASPGPSHNAALQRGLTSWLSAGVKVTQRAYRSHMGFTVSDHKPVSAHFSLQFSYKVDVPLVTLAVEGGWCRPSDAQVRFVVAAGFSRSSSDWIGLYKVGFRHHKDYVAYVLAKQEESDYLSQEHQVTFPEEDLPKSSGEYILGYYSNHSSTIVGVTEPFQVQLPACSLSSDSSSEDDSTLVLLQPQSRSPSPRSRSRSPALPSLKGLNLRPHSRDAARRSPSPRPAIATAATGKRERLVSSSSPSPSSASPSPSGPARLRSPCTPGSEFSAPEALIAAIMGPGPGAFPGGGHQASPGM